MWGQHFNWYHFRPRRPTSKTQTRGDQIGGVIGSLFKRTYMRKKTKTFAVTALHVYDKNVSKRADQKSMRSRKKELKRFCKEYWIKFKCQMLSIMTSCYANVNWTSHHHNGDQAAQ